jgi:hypothetical protein
MVNTYWEEDFTVKSLKLAFKDQLGVVSPVTVVTGDSTTLKVPTAAKAVIISSPIDTSVLTIQLGKEADASAFEDGEFTTDVSRANIELPLQDVTHIKITNTEDADRAVSFAFLTS